METPENTKKKFRKAISDNRFTMDVELDMIHTLVTKYNPMTISDLARKRGVKPSYISKLVKNGKVMFLEFGSQKLIIGE